jgi:heme oxygenase
MRTRLKHATQALHHSVERHLDLDRSDWTIDEYGALLARMWGLYAPLEQALDKIDWQDTGISFEERRKLAWIESDLTQLSVDRGFSQNLEMCLDLPGLDCIAAGLGALYVIEGSTLGGQVIIRRLQRMLGISPVAGGRFFASYGDNIGTMWREYIEALERFSGVTDAKRAIERGAVETFDAFDRWLSGFRTCRVDHARQCHV